MTLNQKFQVKVEWDRLLLSKIDDSTLRGPLSTNLRISTLVNSASLCSPQPAITALPRLCHCIEQYS